MNIDRRQLALPALAIGLVGVLGVVPAVAASAALPIVKGVGRDATVAVPGDQHGKA